MGDTVLGRLQIPGDQDEFTFSGSEGQTLYFDALQYTGDHRNWNFEVLSPSGVRVLESTLADDQFLQLAETGNYRIAISTDNVQLGSYGFRVIDHELTPIVPLDTVITGDLGPGTQSKLYRFAGNQGQRIFIDNLEKSGSIAWTLYNASNQAVASNVNLFDLEVILPVSGDYTLVVQGRSGFTDSASYAFNIITPDLVTQPLPLDTVIDGAIAEKGERDTYTFTGTAGQQLYFDAFNNTANNLRVNVHDANGFRITDFNPRANRGPDQGLTLETDGLYRVVVDGLQEFTGDYKFRFLDRAAAAAVDLDTDVTGTLDDPYGSTLHQFNLDERTYLYVDALQGRGNWILYQSNGQWLRSQSLRFDTEFALDAGDYLLAIEGTGSSDLNYGFRLITPEFETNPLNLGEVITGATVEKGEQDTYTFTGTAGQQLYFDALTSDSSLNNRIRVLDPSGTSLADFASRSDAGPDRLTLPQDGQYRLVVDTRDDHTGGYQFRLLDRAIATDINLDDDITGTFDHNAFGTQLYRLTLDEQQFLYFEGLQGNGRWDLYRANGRLC